MSDDEGRWELPEGWSWRRVGEVVTFHNESVDPRFVEDTEYVGLEHIEPWTGRLLGVGRSSQVKSSKGQFRRGDVLYGKLRPYLAKVVVAVRDGVCTTELLVLRPTSAIATEFLAHALRLRPMVEAVNEATRGTQLPRANARIVASLNVPVPPLDEQRRVLDALEPMLERVAKERTRLERAKRGVARAKRSVLAAAFRGELTSGWRTDNVPAETGASLLSRVLVERSSTSVAVAAKVRRPFVAPALPLPDATATLPGSWTWAPIEAVGEVHLGKKRSPEHHSGPSVRPYLRVANIKRGGVVALDDLLTMNFEPHERDHFAVLPGDILLSEGQSLELVGQSAIYRGGVEGLCFQMTLNRFRPWPSATSSEFMQHVFAHYTLNGVFQRYASMTVNIAHLTLERLKPIPIPLPPLDEQREIVRIIDRWFAALDDVERRVDAALKLCDRLRESLLQRAFRGELVPRSLAAGAVPTGDASTPPVAPLQGTEHPIIMAAPREGVDMSKRHDNREHRFGGPWTETKLGILRGYLAAYNTALSKQDFERVYIDAFAGTGYRTQQSGAAGNLALPDLATDDAQGLLDGSAVYALKTEPAFHRYVFVEKSVKRCEELEALRAQFPERAAAIDVRRGEANEAIRALCEEPWANRRAVLFLDPYGMQVEWKTIEAVARTRAIDLWLLFPLGIGVGRLLTRSGEIPEDWRRRLDLLLGTGDWYDAFYKVEPAPTLFDREATQVARASVEVIGRYFVDRLKTVFAGVAEPRVLRNSTQCPMYLLCFAAANPKGAPIALRIAKHLLEKVD